jgi:hypothetical protein
VISSRSSIVGDHVILRNKLCKRSYALHSSLPVVVPSWLELVQRKVPHARGVVARDRVSSS